MVISLKASARFITAAESRQKIRFRGQSSRSTILSATQSCDMRCLGNLQGRGLKRSAAEAADVADNVYIDGIVCKHRDSDACRIESLEAAFLSCGGLSQTAPSVLCAEEILGFV